MKKKPNQFFWLLSLLLGGLLGVKAQTSGNSGTGANIDVKHHTIYWRVNPDSTKYIRGTITTKFLTKASNVSSLTFDLNKASFNNAFLVVKYHGAVVSKSFPSSGNVNILTISLPAPLALNVTDSVTVSYAGVPPAVNGEALGYQKGVFNGQNYIYTLSESYEDRDWWPCKADMQDKIESMDITVSTPSAFKVATQGKLFKTTVVGSSTKYTYRHRYPIASYLVSLGVAKFTEFNRTPVTIGSTSVPINYQLFTRSSYTSQLAALDFCKLELLLFSTRFGDYPFKNEKFGVYEFGFSGGMEHQTHVGIGSGALTDWSVIAHETAHQWFGDAVSFKTWNSLWLAEGFASYLEVLAAEQIPSLGANAVSHRSSFKSAARSVTVPVYLANISTSNTIWTGSNTSAVYDRGAMMVSMLRALAGDTQFYAATRNYITDPALAYQSADSNNLKAHFQNALGGYDLSGFFSDWVNGVGTPSYAVQWDNAGTTLTVKLTQTRSSNSNVTYFHMPVVLKVSSASGTTQNVVIYDNGGNLALAGTGSIGVGTGTNQISVSLPFTPSTVQFDPENISMATGTVTFNSSLVTKTNEPTSTLAENELERPTVFPNPSNGEFTLRLATNAEGVSDLYVVNEIGVIVQEQKGIQLQKEIVFGQDFPKGVYFVHLNQGEQQFSYKVIKQ